MTRLSRVAEKDKGKSLSRLICAGRGCGGGAVSLAELTNGADGGRKERRNPGAENENGKLLKPGVTVSVLPMSGRPAWPRPTYSRHMAARRRETRPAWEEEDREVADGWVP
ncbi:hypothetical protein PR202_ga27723 [Eleusine coracana subsp. coracana]|uniref:Uncharacterized protein n=1 Tax=Eleusine coracana subsp. coracana TaxID=191504 RepID=A0AAV5DH88_ELECO|nr:hypothetical protein PR202_ga27723 [Eleusine coracana subsp. coracana]